MVNLPSLSLSTADMSCDDGELDNNTNYGGRTTINSQFIVNCNKQLLGHHWDVKSLCMIGK